MLLKLFFTCALEASMECDTSHGGIALGHYRFVRCLVDSHTVLLASFIKLRAYQYMKFEKFKPCLTTLFVLAALSSRADAVEVPGRIQAEDFTSMNGIRTNTTSDAGGGSYVGYIRDGSYTEYDITVPSTGSWLVNARVSSNTSGGTIDFRLNGVSVGTVDVGNTGSWTDFITLQSTLELPEGDHTLQLFYTSENRGYLLDINWFAIRETDQPPATDPAGDPVTGPVVDPVPGPGTEPPQDNTQPNILLVITDDQGIDSSAQYALSNDLPDTPVINSLARNGIVYDNVWAAPSCTPTRAAMLSGFHGATTGVLSVPGELSADFGTIHTFLGENAASGNYETAVFGKWHVDGGNGNLNHPADLGVGYYAGHFSPNITNYSNWTININGVEEQSTTYHTTELVNQTIDWIDDQENPWFAWLAFAAPHAPFHVPPDEFNTRGLSGTQADINANGREYYLSAVETLDTELGRLLDSMDPATRENTVIMVIGDNGTPREVLDTNAFLDGHNKGSLFEGGVRVPLVISGAGVTRTNEREEGLISVVDFFPTIAALTGTDNNGMRDGYNFMSSFSEENAVEREFLYTDYFGNNALGQGWTVRSDRFKYIAYDDGSEALYDLQNDPDETVNMLGSNAAVTAELRAFGLEVRNEGDTETPAVTESAIDITFSILDNNSANCEDYANAYVATAMDANRDITFDANFEVAVERAQCVFTANAIPNHTFNDGATSFPNNVSEQDDEYRVPLNPQFAAENTPLSLSYDDAIMLNGVTVDLLAAGCFGVGNGRVGCNDDDQPWRFDPLSPLSGFRVDSHNAHSQPDGSYHYHGDPNALFDHSGDVASPVIGFAADGFPIFGSYINNRGNVRAAESSYQLRTGDRPTGRGLPGGEYDGSFRDDYEFVAGSGDLDECNGMMVRGVYGYYVTEAFPYMMACFRGTVDESFRK